MNELLAESVPVIGRALLHFVWQGGVIGLLASVALFMLRHARPQSRYLVVCIALLACVLAPLVDILVQLSTTPAVVSSSPAGARAEVQVASVLQASLLPARLWATGGEDWMPTVVALWAAGACVLCLRMVLGIAWIERLRMTTQPAMQARWQARLDALIARLAVRRDVALRLVDGIDSPVSAGCWRPVVLLPTALVTRMPVELVEALLAHELAHVRRHDYLVNLLQGLVEALLFYHPVVWWLSRQARIEREHIADQLAIDALESPRTLAVALAELSDFQSTCSAPPRLAQAAHGGHLMSRIEQLVRPGRRMAGARIAFPLLGIATACLAFYAHARIAGDVPAAKGATAPAPLAIPATVVAPAPQPRPAPRAHGVLGMPAASATATASASVHGIVHVGSDDDRDGYAIVLRDRGGITLSGDVRDARTVETLRRGLDSDFLWARRGGREYTITDPALVARAGRAWQGSEALGREMEALGRQMAPHTDSMKALGREMGQLAGRAGPSPEMLKAQQRIGELAGRQGELAARQARHAAREQARIAARGEFDEARMEREMEGLEARIEAEVEAEMEALEAQIEREAERIEVEAERMARRSAPMEALGRRMEEAAKPMEALGERMEALGERQARLSEQAERETQDVIDDAIERALARPANASKP